MKFLSFQAKDPDIFNLPGFSFSCQGECLSKCPNSKKTPLPKKILVTRLLLTAKSTASSKARNVRMLGDSKQSALGWILTGNCTCMAGYFNFIKTLSLIWGVFRIHFKPWKLLTNDTKCAIFQVLWGSYIRICLILLLPLSWMYFRGRWTS